MDDEAKELESSFWAELFKLDALPPIENPVNPTQADSSNLELPLTSTPGYFDCPFESANVRTYDGTVQIQPQYQMPVSSDCGSMLWPGPPPTFVTAQVAPAPPFSSEPHRNLTSSPLSVYSFRSSPTPSVDSAGLSSLCLDEHIPSSPQVPAAGRKSSEPMDDTVLMADVGTVSPSPSDDKSAQKKKSKRPTRRRSESRFNDALKWVKARIKARDIDGSKLPEGAKFSCPYCKHVSLSKHR
ncbi:hypothetical protein CF319_g1549 [Tilletia indica]|nr:hypothetical protein CF319_g1549 [Tilletia indica]